MDLSIIIPCHNVARHITPLINSLNCQKFQYDVEIWFILDNCTDYTEAIIRRKINYQLYDVHIVNQNFNSCGLARNLGIEMSTGKFIWFIDGDDWLLQDDAIHALVTLMYQTRLPIIRFRFESNRYPSNLNYYMMVWQYIFRRDLIGDIRFPNIQPDEDLKFMDEIHKKTKYILFIDVPIYYYNYLRPDSNMYQFVKNGKINP